MAKYNILAKCEKGREYIITDMIATPLNKKTFEKMQAVNDFLADYKFINYNDTDFSWWDRITKYLTRTKLVNGYTFNCDWWGNITKY